MTLDGATLTPQLKRRRARKMTIPEGKAFPLLMDDGSHNAGLTKREHFAAMAMQGMMANPQRKFPCGTDAVESADALIAALNKKEGA